MEEASELQEPPGLRRTGGLSADFTGALSFPLGVRVSAAAACSRAGCVADPPLEAMRPERVGRRSATGSGRPPDPRPLRSKRQPLVR